MVASSPNLSGHEAASTIIVMQKDADRWPAPFAALGRLILVFALQPLEEAALLLLAGLLRLFPMMMVMIAAGDLLARGDGRAVALFHFLDHHLLAALLSLLLFGHGFGGATGSSSRSGFSAAADICRVVPFHTGLVAV